MYTVNHTVKESGDGALIPLRWVVLEVTGAREIIVGEYGGWEQVERAVELRSGEGEWETAFHLGKGGKYGVGTHLREGVEYHYLAYSR